MKFPKVKGYEIIALIGEGGFGTVYTAKPLGEKIPKPKKGKKIVALKIVKPLSNSKKNHEKKAIEIYMRMRSASKKGLIEILDVGRTDSGQIFYTMPLGERTLFDVANKKLKAKKWFSMEEIKGILSQLFDALESLESEGLVHRDIKPTNIISLNGKYYLSDLGLLEIEDDGSSRYGTENFQAPRFFKGNPDHWSVACIIFFLLTSKYPEDWTSAANWVSPLGEKNMSREEIAEYKRLRDVVFNRATAYRAIDVFRNAQEFRTAVLNSPKLFDKPVISCSLRSCLILLVLLMTATFTLNLCAKKHISESQKNVSSTKKSDGSSSENSKTSTAKNSAGEEVVQNSETEAQKAKPREMDDFFYNNVKAFGHYDEEKKIYYYSLVEWVDKCDPLVEKMDFYINHRVYYYYGFSSQIGDYEKAIPLKENIAVMQEIANLWVKYRGIKKGESVITQASKRTFDEDGKFVIIPAQKQYVTYYDKCEPFYQKYVEQLFYNGGKDTTLFNEKLKKCQFKIMDYETWAKNVEAVRASIPDLSKEPKTRYRSIAEHLRDRLTTSRDEYDFYVSRVNEANKILSEIFEKPAKDFKKGDVKK